jgi:hypothetical protein
MSAAAEFKTRLGEFSELHSSMGPSHGAAPAAAQSNNASTNANEPSGSSNKRSASGGDQDGLIKSETIVKDRKRYYLDLKENQRGRFLRVSMVVTRGPRAYLGKKKSYNFTKKKHLISSYFDHYQNY